MKKVTTEQKIKTLDYLGEKYPSYALMLKDIKKRYEEGTLGKF